MLNDSTDTTPEFSYQEVPAVVNTPTSAAPLEQALSNDGKERIAFEAYVRDQGGKIPTNFKDAGSWFDSLKNAQKEYTQSKQEIAALKTKYADSTTNPDFVATPEVVAKPTNPNDTEQGILRIPDKKVEEVVPPTKEEVSSEDWKTWTVEYATKGTLSEETQALIKAKTNLPDFVISQYMEGQKAQIEIAYSKASVIIGGKEKLNDLFAWASKNLSKPEQENMNASLASPNWEIALLGLNAKYDKVNSSNKKEEPITSNSNQKMPSSAAQQTLIPYRTKREFYTDRNNPRFKQDPKYRAAVEQRMMQTDFNKLQA